MEDKFILELLQAFDSSSAVSLKLQKGDCSISLKKEDAFEKKLQHENENVAVSKENTIKNDAVLALNALGYSQTESLKAVSKVDIADGMGPKISILNSFL